METLKGIFTSNAEYDNALAAAAVFYEEYYGERVHAAIYKAMAEFRQRGIQSHDCPNCHGRAIRFVTDLFRQDMDKALGENTDTVIDNCTICGEPMASSNHAFCEAIMNS